jgi:leader peptidase (prepilin peptidase) / N-methyltransferase
MADLNTILSRETWASVPFHFWSVVFFVFGSMVGSFLNVCIHRMPTGLSIVKPRSRCPHCEYAIPWFLNMPLITWLVLRGKCANCKAPISIRYFLVEFLTGLAFLACWLNFGHQSAGLALVASLILAGFIVATFIDIEHLIIPDEITIGGMFAGLVCSALVPMLHDTLNRGEAMRSSAIGLAVGAGFVYLVLRAGKLAFGREVVSLPPEGKVIFTETALQLPDKEVLYQDIFYRKSDVIQFVALQLELPDRCFFNTLVRLTPERLVVGDQSFNPEEVPHMEAVARDLVLPREAMGFGDVKFMGAIGAFLGWYGAAFAFLASACLGSLVGVTAILARRREWSSRIPYGPYIAVAATIWLFLPPSAHAWWKASLGAFKQIFTGGL